LFTINIEQWVPKFILGDKNGYALAKAIEAALNRMNQIVDQGVHCIWDYDTMPEWRIDELAWEYNIPYDYTADLEIKREWVRQVHAMSRLYGTPEGLTRFMAAYFDGADIQEARDYDGSPYHFRMLFPDTWTPKKIEWATTAINAVKNVRSVLDSYIFRREWLRRLWAGCALYTYESATYQLSAITVEDDWYTDELDNIMLDENGIVLIVE